MFERFTTGSRRAIVLAQEEARLLNHNYIGTEHVLLGLLAERESTAARVLESLTVTLDGARELVRDIVGEGQQEKSGHIPFTPRAKKVLELSLREAMSMRGEYIGTEHLLLGLVSEGDGVGAQILGRLGATPGAVRERVAELAGAGTETEAGTEAEAGIEARPGPGSADLPSDLPSGVMAGLRAVRVRTDVLDDIMRLLASVDQRLAAIERHLGIASGQPAETPAPAEPQAPAETPAPAEPQAPAEPEAPPAEPEAPAAPPEPADPADAGPAESA